MRRWVMRSRTSAISSPFSSTDGNGSAEMLIPENFTGRPSACDAFVAMTSPRPHAAERGEEAALEELQRCAGTQFDPVVVDTLGVVLASRVAAPPSSAR